ncbi:MAG: restriction endonuclease subunit S [Melioribacteraceae bacterium]|nr:restriction endonuclease subunit S [Melioribacteraceae bacterium]
MSEWKDLRIGDIGEVITGKTPSKNNPEEWGTEMPFITPSDYKSYRKFANSSERKLSRAGIDRFSNKVLPQNSVLVTCIGSDMGKVVINKIPVVTNQQINSIIPNTDIITSDFLYYQLVNIYDTLRVYGGDGTAVPIVNKSDFEGIELSLPLIPEQKAIAGVLSSLDGKIDLLHRQNKTLEAMAETFFRQWFIEAKPQPSPNLSQRERNKIMKDESWEEKPLDEIADFLNGLACQKYPPKNEIEKLHVLKIKELRNGFTENSDWASTDIANEYIIENGDVIFSWSGSLMVKIWDGEKCILNQHLFKVASHNYPKWFYYFWTKHHLEKFISIAESKSTTMGHIKREDLSNSIVLIPEETELKEMDNSISPILDKIIINNRQIRTLEKLRGTLLPKLMSGEVRVNPGGMK